MTRVKLAICLIGDCKALFKTRDWILVQKGLGSEIPAALLARRLGWSSALRGPIFSPLVERFELVEQTTAAACREERALRSCPDCRCRACRVGGGRNGMRSDILCRRYENRSDFAAGFTAADNAAIADKACDGQSVR